MRNAVIGLVFVVILGAAGVLGWMAWQNMQRDPAAGDIGVTEGGETTPGSQDAPSNVPGDGAALQSENGESENGDPEDSEPVTQATPAIGSPQDQLHLVYLWNNRLGLWSGGEDQSLSTADAAHPPRISHDGSLIAFARDGALWVMSAQDGQERLLVGELEFVEMGSGGNQGRLHRFEWLPDSRQLIFNTAADIEVGVMLTNDLYRVDAESLALEQLLAPGQGGEFAIAPAGRHIAVVSPSQIRFVDWEGNPVRDDFPFAVVQTYGSFAYYPHPVWSQDGGRVVVAIPAPDGFVNANEPATIWSVTVEEGAPALVAQFQAGAPSYWIDPTLAHIAYLQVVTDSDDGPLYALEIAALDGSEPHARFEGVNQFTGWSPAGTHFMVATPGEAHSLHLGSMADDQLIPLDGLYYAYSHQTTWIDDEHFVVSGVGDSATDLAFGALDGALEPILRWEDGALTFHLASTDAPVEAKQ